MTHLISDEVLASLIPDRYKTCVGWITSEGQVVKCDIMDHISALPEQFREHYRTCLDHNLKEVDEHMRNLGPDDHPEWHRFAPESDALNDAQKSAMDAGYLRFGIFSRDGEMHIELNGFPAFLKKHHDVIAYMAAGLDAEVWFTSRDDWSCTRRRQKHFR